MCSNEFYSDPTDYNLSSDYKFATKLWGNFFYKIYEPMSYTAAKVQCESDGAFLAVPRSDAENDFIAGLLPQQHIWIGIDDIDQAGVFVAVDGRPISYENWYHNQPDNYYHG